MVLEILGEHDRILLELKMTNTLRPSELFVLRWRYYDPRYLKLVIQETAP